jgi:hypothetical protein
LEENGPTPAVELNELLGGLMGLKKANHTLAPQNNECTNAKTGAIWNAETGNSSNDHAKRAGPSLLDIGRRFEFCDSEANKQKKQHSTENSKENAYEFRRWTLRT